MVDSQDSTVDSPARGHRGLRRDRIIFAVIIFCIVAGSSFLVGTGASTYWGAWLDYGVTGTRYFYPVVYERSVEHGNGGIVRETTEWYPLNGLLILVGTAVVSLGLTKCAASLRPRATISPALAIILASLFLIGFGVSIWFSMSYWGYWPGPPRIDERVTSARRVTGMGGFMIDVIGRASSSPEWCELPEAKPSDPTRSPLEYTLNEWKRAGLPVRSRGQSPLTVAELKRLPLRIKNDSGYDSRSGLWGFWAELEAKDGARLLYVVGNGREHSDDHWPHYRLLYKRNGAKLDPMGHQVFYFDWAGIGWMTWIVLFCWSALPVSWAAIVLSFIYFGAARLRQRIRDTS